MEYYFIQEKTLSNYEKQIRFTARGLWQGKIDLVDFFDGMEAVIRRGFEQAWREGAGSCNIKPDERTIEETQLLNEQIAISINSIFGFGQFIESNSKKNKGLWRNIQPRLKIWYNSYNRILNLSKSTSCKDLKLQWVLGAAEHCKDCLNLSGRVYRASIWRKYNLYPQNTRLQCKGFRCKCRFVETKLPVTPGRPPNI